MINSFAEKVIWCHYHRFDCPTPSAVQAVLSTPRKIVTTWRLDSVIISSPNHTVYLKREFPGYIIEYETRSGDRKEIISEDAARYLVQNAIKKGAEIDFTAVVHHNVEEELPIEEEL